MSFVKDEWKALQYIGKRKYTISTVDTICEQHYEALIGRYKDVRANCTRRCCDPFKRHYDQFSTGLRSVNMVILLKAQNQDLHLVYGNKICTNCIKKLFDPSSEDSGEAVAVTSKSHGGSDAPGTPVIMSKESGSSSSSAMIQH